MCNICLKQQTDKLKETRTFLKGIPRFTTKERTFAQEAEAFLKQHLLDRVFINNAINLSYL